MFPPKGENPNFLGFRHATAAEDGFTTPWR